VKRRLFNLSVGISLLLCVATVVLWVRSYRYPDRFEMLVSHHRETVQSWRGGLYFSQICHHQYFGFKRNDFPVVWLGWPTATKTYPSPLLEGSTETQHSFRFVGVEFFSGENWQSSVVAIGFPDISWTAVCVPDWSLCLFGGLLPLCKIRTMWRNTITVQRRLHDLCPTCGYDLRATPDRCPECGRVPVKSKVEPT